MPVPDRQGSRAPDPLPSDRTRYWLAERRFALDTALWPAAAHAPHIVIKG